MNICSCLWPISLWQRRVHISQQMMSYIDFSFFIIYIFSKFYFFGAQGPPKIQIYVWFAFFLFLGPLGPLRGPRAPKNRILLNFSKNPKIYKKSLFYIKKGPGALKKEYFCCFSAPELAGALFYVKKAIFYKF